MNKKKIILAAFILVALAQLYIPLKMILDREKVLNEGREFKFKTAPIDPNDPFRGKYVYLNYNENRAPVNNIQEWESYETAYALLAEDEDGFVKIESITKEKPQKNKNFLKTKIGYISKYDSAYVFIDYPFNRFYMEETKAPEAERIYASSANDTAQVAYALVNILDGEAVLKDVLINGVPIGEMVKNRQENQEEE